MRRAYSCPKKDGVDTGSARCRPSQSVGSCPAKRICTQAAKAQLNKIVIKDVPNTTGTRTVRYTAPKGPPPGLMPKAQSLDTAMRKWVFQALREIAEQNLPDDAAVWTRWYAGRRSQKSTGNSSGAVFDCGRRVSPPNGHTLA
jgi:hypothetical protein